MATTYEPIATTTLGSDTTPVTFSSIPSTYTDLVVMVNTRGSNNIESDFYIRFNSDSGSNYSRIRLYGFGTSAGTDKGNNELHMNIGRQGANVWAPNIINIMDYSNTTTYKTVIARTGHATPSQAIVLSSIGLWRSTSAITSITFIQGGAQSYKIGSTFTLYGIKAA